MSRRIASVCLLLICQMMLVSQVEGQILRRRLRERRAAAAAAQDPAAQSADAAAAPLPRLRGLLARRLRAQQDLVAQEENQPTPAAPGQNAPAAADPAPRRRFAARQDPSDVRQASANQAPRTPRFNLRELTNLDFNRLQNALANVDGALQNDLNRFSSAESWQGFLNLPEAVVDQQTVDPEALRVSLDRFNRVATNPEFSQIAGLESFEQTRGILAELANRVVGPKLGDPATETELAESPASSGTEESAELLPAPQTTSAPRRANKREHSILVRSR